MTLDLRETGDGAVLLRVKAVPGARRDEIAGVLGERLKIRISAPAEGGKANKAICALLAKTLGVRAGDVQIVAGASRPEKTVRIDALDAGEVTDRLTQSRR
ncbi:MAG: DUF167 domain-containing protein [Planctomycetota bacterium]